jgi:lysophospholipase L1-like esterase
MTSGHTRLFRGLGIAWLILAATASAALTGELWLRIERWRSLQIEERYRKANVFFANAMELNVGDHSVWERRWFSYRPGARAEVVSGGQRFVIEINSWGYRTHEFEVPKPPGTVRVVCIGGSTTVAGRTNDETYPALLEKSLRARYPGLAIEVLDLGVSGVTSEHWRNELHRVLDLEPDVVVHYQAINDVSWWHLARYAEAHPWRRLAASSLLLERLFPLPVDDLSPYIRDTMDTFAAIARRCRERGVVYLGASFAGPDPPRLSGDFARHLDVNTEFWARRFPLHRYSTLAALIALHNRLFVEFVNREHVAHVLVHRELGDPALFIDACHFTPAGIERLAQAFLPAVAALVERTRPYHVWAAGRGTTVGRAAPRADRAGAGKAS